MTDQGIQHKPAGANHFFGADGSPVNVVCHASDDQHEWLIDLLLESGLDLATAEMVADSFNEKLLERFNSLANERAMQMAGDKLRLIVLALVDSPFDRTPSGRGLRRALLGDYGRSLAEDATACRCSAPAIHYHQKQIEERLSHLIKQASPRIDDE